MKIVRTLLLLPLAASALTVAAPASAAPAARITVTNEFGRAQADPTYATELTLRGRGFQAIKNGHGGIYVFFGTTRGTWQPSRGGVTGTNYLYVPDTESKNNQGFQKFIAFEGSDTASAAQGVIAADGSWTTTIKVPGATFRAVDRDGKVANVDCRTVTCGLITIGAHGVVNARNETFTPIRFTSLYGASQPRASSSAPAPTASQAAPATAAPAASPSAAAPQPNTAAPAKALAAAVDPDTAVVGRVLSFTGSGFAVGEQVTASFDKGRAAVGPLPAGASGEVAGVLTLPADLKAGTHTLRLTGAASGRKTDVNFPVAADADRTVAASPVARTSAGMPAATGWAFLAVALAVLVLAVFFAQRRVRNGRRANATAGVSDAA